MRKIFFHSEEIDFKLDNEHQIIKWISKVITNESKIIGDISYIFCSDDYLLKVNQDHLNHDYYTDIITFDYCQNGIISGDLFISIDRVTDNASQLKVSFNQELCRVIIHGILHLLGNGDKTEKEALIMRNKEEDALNLLLDLN